MSVTETVTVSAHARTRWAQRSDNPEMSPQAAWHDAVDVEFPAINPPADTARYHPPTGMLLLAAPDDTITTCIPLSYRPQTEQQYIRSQVSDQ